MKIHRYFHVLQLFGKKFWKFVRSLNSCVYFLIVWLNSWGQRSWFPGVCRNYHICNDSYNKFYYMQLTVSSVRCKSTCISKFLTISLFILFTGMRFGLMQVKTGLCHILSRFEVAPCKEMPLPIVYETKSFLMQMHGKFRLSFNRVQFWTTYIYLCTIELKYRHK